MIQNDCEYCRIDNGNYLFSNDCCLARFILHVPTKAIRAGYLEWWMKKYGSERTEHVKALVSEAWETDRAKGRNDAHQN